jgi:succinate dehydrogenase / fumarate reductase flavoprotein subunit
MRIFPAVHYTMGGLWVDYELQSNVPGLFVLGEANFSDHGANRLGASALMQGLADGYFVIPYTLGNYIANESFSELSGNEDAFAEAESAARGRIDKLLSINGSRTVTEFHRELGRIMWDEVGMSRTAGGLQKAVDSISSLREEFWQDVRVPGEPTSFNKYLEFAGRVADFLELGELMARDALEREESCGGHFREEHQSPEGEAKRNDEDFTHVSAWEQTENGHVLHKENLEFENVQLTTRSYK